MEGEREREISEGEWAIIYLAYYLLLALTWEGFFVLFVWIGNAWPYCELWSFYSKK